MSEDQFVHVTQCPWTPEKGVGSLGARVTDRWGPCSDFQETDSFSPLQWKYVLLSKNHLSSSCMLIFDYMLGILYEERKDNLWLWVVLSPEDTAFFLKRQVDQKAENLNPLRFCWLGFHSLWKLIQSWFTLCPQCGPSVLVCYSSPFCSLWKIFSWGSIKKGVLFSS